MECEQCSTRRQMRAAGLSRGTRTRHAFHSGTARGSHSLQSLVLKAPASNGVNVRPAGRLVRVARVCRRRVRMAMSDGSVAERDPSPTPEQTPAPRAVPTTLVVGLGARGLRVLEQLAEGRHEAETGVTLVLVSTDEKVRSPSPHVWQRVGRGSWLAQPATSADEIGPMPQRAAAVAQAWLRLGLWLKVGSG